MVHRDTIFLEVLMHCYATVLSLRIQCLINGRNECGLIDKLMVYDILEVTISFANVGTHGYLVKTFTTYGRF